MGIRVLFISNFGIKFDEGMRNIAKHLVEEFRPLCEVVIPITFRELPALLMKYTLKTGPNVIHILYRYDHKAYFLAVLLRALFPRARIIFSLVQPPRSNALFFLQLCPDPINRYLVLAQDIYEMLHNMGKSVGYMQCGIDMQKFYPTHPEIKMGLRNKYEIPAIKPVILHVGHLSKGRSLEIFLKIDGQKYTRVVVSSKLFTFSDIAAQLKQVGVCLIQDFIPQIQEFYQLADIYFFPTKDRNYVIDIPLSILEAMAVNLPVLSVRVPGVESLIRQTTPYFSHLDCSSNINVQIESLLALDNNYCNLSANLTGYSWENAAKQIFAEYVALIG